MVLATEEKQREAALQAMSLRLQAHRTDAVAQGETAAPAQARMQAWKRGQKWMQVSMPAWMRQVQVRQARLRTEAARR